MPKLSVVAPVHNEAACLPEFLLRLGRVLDGLTGWQTEVLLVDDGSRDSSAALIRSAMLADSRLRLLSLTRNFGHQQALTCGLDQADGDVVVSLDSDLQDPPELIPALLQRWEQGSSVVYARRRRRDGDSVFKRVTAHAFYRLIAAASDVALPVDVGDFRLLDRRVVLELRRLRESDRYLRGMVAWLGFGHDFVDYDRDPRRAGETHYPLRSMLRLASDALTSFSDAPLRLLRRLSLLFTVLAFGLGFWSLLGKLLAPGHSAAGYTTVLAAITFTGGVQLWCLSVLGAYVGRLYGHSRGRPLYVIDAPLDVGAAHYRGPERRGQPAADPAGAAAAPAPLPAARP